MLRYLVFSVDDAVDILGMDLIASYVKNTGYLALLCILFMLGSYAYAGFNPQLAYLKGGWLWVVRVNETGKPPKGVKPLRLCRLWSVSGEETVNLFWSPSGNHIVIEHWVRTSNKGRYGLPPGREYSGIWLVEVKQNTKPRKVAMGADPSFSPDGKYLAFTCIPGGDVLVSDHAYKVCILNLSTNQIRTLRENAREPFWSSDGREIALIDTSPQDFSASALIVDAQTGKIRFQTDKMVNPTTPLLSPNGRYLAVHPHMSRPLTGHVIIDRQRGELLDYDFYPKGYAPGHLNAWSSDGKWLLWTVRIPDPENDGSWLQEEIWLISIDAKVKRKIGVGIIGDFSPDGKHVLWLRPSRKTKRRQLTYDLMWSPLQGLKKVRLVSQVNAFAIYKPPK